MSHILAAALFHRAINSGGRDAVLALREIADRTEGPVVQRTENRDVRFVVSVTPQGSVGAPTIGRSPEDWERMARADWEEGRTAPIGALPPPGKPGAR